MKTTAFALMAALAAAPAAFASDEPEWEAFRATVKTACSDAARATLGETEAFVDPFGSASYGLAVMRSVVAPNIAVFCVYDKTTHKVELGGQMENRDTAEEARPDAVRTAQVRD